MFVKIFQWFYVDNTMVFIMFLMVFIHGGSGRIFADDSNLPHFPGLNSEDPKLEAPPIYSPPPEGEQSDDGEMLIYPTQAVSDSVVFGPKIVFVKSQSQLTPAHREQLEKLAAKLNEHLKSWERITIVGYVAKGVPIPKDVMVSTELNQQISKKSKKPQHQHQHQHQQHKKHVKNKKNKKTKKKDMEKKEIVEEPAPNINPVTLQIQRTNAVKTFLKQKLQTLQKGQTFLETKIETREGADFETLEIQINLTPKDDTLNDIDFNF